MSKTNSFDHRAAYQAGSRILQEIDWHPEPTEMFEAPSRAKGGLLQLAAMRLAPEVKTMDHALLAARIDYFIAIGGEAARDYFLGDQCRLDAKKIGRLSRRMPPFIADKLKDLYAGSANIDANPTGAFDTNGWPELRVRLPKFAAMLLHYARQSDGMMEFPEQEKLRTLLSEILTECDRLLAQLKRFTPQGDGQERAGTAPLPRELEWSKAGLRFAQALGVLRKCNRDLASTRWREEWVPTKADLEFLRKIMARMSDAAQHTLIKLQELFAEIVT